MKNRGQVVTADAEKPDKKKPSSFSGFYHLMLDYVFVRCKRTLKNEEVSSEAAHDVLAMVWEMAVERGQCAAEISEELLDSCISRICDLKRKQWVREAARFCIPIDVIEQTAVDPTLNATEQLLERERLHQVARTIKSLPRELRSSVVLRFLEGHSHENIALILKVERSTVSRRLQRALQIIQQRIEEENAQCKKLP
jgi:RNA polymerase sigma factor (sigma-70 family)